MSHYSSKYGSGGGNYHSRSRDNDRSRDKDWGRDRRRNDRDRSRDRVPRSPARESRIYDNARDKRQQDDRSTKYISRFNRFSREQPQRGYHHREEFRSHTGLIREKDLIQNLAHFRGPTGGYGDNHYGAYHYGSHGHFSEFRQSAGSPEQRPVAPEKQPDVDPEFKAMVDACITNLKTRGDYDKVRRECVSDMDTKAAYINLLERIKSTVDKHLTQQPLVRDMEKVRTREGMRKKIVEAKYFDNGIQSLVSQITPKLNTVLRSTVEEEVYKFLNIDKTKAESEAKADQSVTDAEQSGNADADDKLRFNPVLSKDISLGVGPMDISQSPESCNNGTETCPSMDISPADADSNISSDAMAKRKPFENESCDRSPSRHPTTCTMAASQMAYVDESQVANHPQARSQINLQAGAPEILPSIERHILPDIRVPPPHHPSAAHPPSISTGVMDSCHMSNLRIPLPYIQAAVGYTHPTTHYAAMGVPGQVLSLPPLPQPPLPLLPHPSEFPPPLPLPLPIEVPPPPPSTPPPSPPPPPCVDESASAPPPPPGVTSALHNPSASCVSFQHFHHLESGADDDNDEAEPLPPGEEPDAYFNKMREKLSYFKQADVTAPADSTSAAENASPDLVKDVEEEEMEEEEEEDVEEDSEEESPMFEKIGEVSPPRAVELQNFELVQELSKKLFHDSSGVPTNNEGEENMKISVEPDDDAHGDCRYLESTPMYDYKISYYKKIPDE